ncbi:hypothetical protein APHAL10511_007743 [Amanita phalloides]|nr:hypothetical protein APHAL10511_007743 [Amanita phalloides]
MSSHTLRQLKLIVPGVVITYYLGTLDEIWHLFHGHVGSWPQSATLIIIANNGVEPDFRSWRQSVDTAGIRTWTVGSVRAVRDDVWDAGTASCAKTPMYSNNPFIDDPTTTTTHYTSWVNPQYHQTQYSLQTQPTGYAQLQPPASYAYVASQTTQQAPVYNPAQQQILSNPGYVAQFDPYAPTGQRWGGLSNQRSQLLTGGPTSVGSIGLPSSQQTPTTSRSATGLLHPREFVRVHKIQIESWDGHTWRQLLTTLESLKDAWDARKKALSSKAGQLLQQLQYANQYQAQHIQQEGSRLQALWKEAETNFDSVAASVFQMREVFSGYRHSPDLASKKRVRAATNVALQTLPDWPSQFY